MISFVRAIRKINSKGQMGFSIPHDAKRMVEIGKTYQITIDEIGAEIKPEVKNP